MNENGKDIDQHELDLIRMRKMKALMKAPAKRATSMEKPGLSFQSWASARPTGSRAPVRTNPCPAIISAQTATNASCPKPWKNSTALETFPLSSKGKISNPEAKMTNMSKLEDSRGTFLRVNKKSAITVSINTASACGLGGGGMFIFMVSTDR